MCYGDAVILDEEKEISIMYHPYQPGKSSNLKDYRNVRLLRKVMENGEILTSGKTIKEISENVRKKLSGLPDEHKRFENPHIYKVGISEKLMNLRNSLIDKVRIKNKNIE